MSRTFFSVKQSGNNEQAVYFNALSIWLLSICGATVQGDLKYADPVTIATNILTEMKNVGIELNIPPNSLRTVFYFFILGLW